MPFEFDVVIIGAGAAGLATARKLSRSSLRVLLVEARSRIGGRAHTFLPEAGLPLDLGCGWLHSAHGNPLVQLIEAAGFVLDRAPPAWGRQAGNVHFPAEDQERYHEAFEAFETRLVEAAERGEDRPASDYLDAGGRWNGLLNAFSSFYNGAEFDRVSVKDYGAYEDSGVNWRVRDGYGAGIAALAQLPEVALSCPVSRIDHSGESILVETGRGTIRTKRVVLAVPSAHIAERIAFAPGLREKQEAASALPLGLANKAFLRVSDPEALPKGGHVFGRTDTAATGSYHLRPFGRPYIECFVGGRNARSLEEAGTRALLAFAVEELTGLFGSDFARKLDPVLETAWAADPYALGSYSHALPGHADARATLAQPHENRLFFAGEATHGTAFSTAHGAWESGERAADEVLASFK